MVYGSEREKELKNLTKQFTKARSPKMNNKELGREELKSWLNKCWSLSGTSQDEYELQNLAYQQIKKLIQQSGEKPEIDEKFIKKWAKDLWDFPYDCELKDMENFIRQIVAEVGKAKITDDLLDDIIDAVLEHATCHHDVSRDEDGIHYSSEYDIDSEKKVKEKLRKILKGGD